MQGFKGNISRVQIFNIIEERQIFNDKIIYIENYPIKEQNNEYAWIDFNYQKCFPLNIFLQGLKYHYLRVFDGQLIILAKEIFYHFKEIQRGNCIHGNLESKNIIVEIEEDSQGFVTYARKVEIKKIYFTNYEFQYQQKQSQYDDFQQIKQIIIQLFSFINNKELKQKFSLEISKGKTQEELETFIKEQFWQVDDNQKLVKIDFEDSYTSYRYLYCDKYAKEFDLDKILQEFKNEFDQQSQLGEQGKSEKNQDQEVNIITEEAISLIKITQKNQEILQLEINENEGLIQNDQDIEQNQLKSLQKLIGQAKQKLNDSIIQLYLNRFYEEAVCYIVKDLGEYLNSDTYYQKYSLKISKESIDKSFICQQNCFHVLINKIQNLERNFIEIANDLISKHFQIFKFQIDLNPEEILQLHNTQILKYIMQNKFIEKESNFLYNHDFQEFEQAQKKIIKESMLELISLLQQIEILKLILQLI